MAQRILIGNLISLATSVFLFWGSISESVKRVYLFGVFECMLLFVAQLFFGQGAAAVSLLIAAFRNFLLYSGKYTLPHLIIVFSGTLFFGITFNTGGILGLVPLLATLIFTLTSYFAKTYIKVKLSLFLNLSLWAFYSIIIFDFSSALINIFSLILIVVSIIKHLNKRNV